MSPNPRVHHQDLANSRTRHPENLAKAKATMSTLTRLPRRHTTTLQRLLRRPLSALVEALLSHQSIQVFLRAQGQQVRLVRCKIHSRARSVGTRCLVKRWRWAVARPRKPWPSLKAITTRTSILLTTMLLHLAQGVISFTHNRVAFRHFLSQPLYTKGLLLFSHSSPR